MAANNSAVRPREMFDRGMCSLGQATECSSFKLAISLLCNAPITRSSAAAVW